MAKTEAEVTVGQTVPGTWNGLDIHPLNLASEETKVVVTESIPTYTPPISFASALNEFILALPITALARVAETEPTATGISPAVAQKRRSWPWDRNGNHLVEKPTNREKKVISVDPLKQRQLDWQITHPQLVSLISAAQAATPPRIEEQIDREVATLKKTWGIKQVSAEEVTNIRDRIMGTQKEQGSAEKALRQALNSVFKIEDKLSELTREPGLRNIVDELEIALINNPSVWRHLSGEKAMPPKISLVRKTLSGDRQVVDITVDYHLGQGTDNFAMDRFQYITPENRVAEIAQLVAVNTTRIEDIESTAGADHFGIQELIDHYPHLLSASDKTMLDIIHQAKEKIIELQERQVAVLRLVDSSGSINGYPFSGEKKSAIPVHFPELTYPEFGNVGVHNLVSTALGQPPLSIFRFRTRAQEISMLSPRS